MCTISQWLGCISEEWCEYLLWGGLYIIAKNVQIHSKIMTKCRNLVILGWIHSSKCMKNQVILTSIKNLGHSAFLERTCLRIPVKNHVDRFRRVFGAVLLQQKNFTIYWGSVRASRSDGTRFSGSSAKRAFHLSCHDRKVESAHWVVFFGTSFLLTTSQNPQTETLNRFTLSF